MRPHHPTILNLLQCIFATSVDYARLQDCVHNSHLNWPFQARLLQFPFLHHQLLSNETPTNNSERSCRAVTNTPKHHHITLVIKSLHWLKVLQRIQYKLVSLTYNTLPTSQLNPLTDANYSPYPTARVYLLIIII